MSLRPLAPVRCSFRVSPLAVLAAAWILAIGLLVGAGSALAQDASPAGGEQTVSVADLESLVATIEDDAKRTELVTQLKALIAAQQGAEAAGPPESLGAQFIALLSDNVRQTGSQLLAFADVVRDVPAVYDWMSAQVTDADARADWLALLGRLFVVLVAGWLAEWLVRLLLRSPRAALEARAPGPFVVKLTFLTARTLLDLVPVAVFWGAAYGALVVVRPVPEVQVVVVTFVNAYLLARIVGAVVLMVLAPAAPSLRLLPLDSETAQYLTIWARRLAIFGIYGYFTAEAALLFGMPESGHAGLLRVIGLVLAVMIIVFILQNRAEVAAWLRGRSGSGALLRRRLSEVWHVLAVLYVSAVFVVWALDVEGGFTYLLRATIATFVIVSIAALVMALIRRLIDRGFTINDELKALYPTLEWRANRYLPVLHAALRVVVGIVAVLALLQAWGVDVLTAIDSPNGRRFVGAVVTIALVLLAAVMIWEVARSAIERYLAQTDTDGNIVERSARARTLLPLLRNALFILLCIMVTLIVLSEVGLDIAPLLAGAGVVGLAIGFGSQKMVQDVITGAFMLFEDAINVGDVVNVAGIGGLVEGLSIRSIRLRDLSGNVHTIPFSSVDTVTNMTKEFSYYLLDIGVAYREDTDQVSQVVTEIVDGMRDDPTYADLILEPLEVLGVDQFADSAVIIKARIKTKPIQQWTVGREFNRRMKKRFDELGIEIPFPHQTVYFGIDKDGAAPPARVRVEGGVTAPPVVMPAPVDPPTPEIPGPGDPPPRQMPLPKAQLPDANDP